ncbi:UNVERIFIED_ORG: hypothetical protein GGI57_006062 [Rhizobium aethiopicum]
MPLDAGRAFTPIIAIALTPPYERRPLQQKAVRFSRLDILMTFVIIDD